MKPPIISLELFLVLLVVLLWASRSHAATDTLTFSTAITAPQLTISGTTLLNGATNQGTFTNNGNFGIHGTLLVDSTITTKLATVATNGFQSNARNLATPLAITVGSSPLLLTNSAATALGGTNNFYVFVDGSGVTGTVGINGTTIFSGVTGADCTIPLQPGEYMTLTWSIGTPVVKAKPF